MNSSQLNKVLKEGGKVAAAKAAAYAPKSGSKEWYNWTKGRHSYKGKHGDLGLKSTYATRIWRRGGGFFLQAGGRRRSTVGGNQERRTVQVIVSKFAGFNVRRTPGGKATKGQKNNWIQKAIDETAKHMTKKAVVAFESATADVLITEIKKKRVGQRASPLRH